MKEILAQVEKKMSDTMQYLYKSLSISRCSTGFAAFANTGADMGTCPLRARGTITEYPAGDYDPPTIPVDNVAQVPTTKDV